MQTEFLNLTSGNIADEHLCCIIRSRKPHAGVEAKRSWISARLEEGHVFRKLNERAAVFIEYAPLEKAWVPITGDDYYYIYCLWVLGEYKGRGYGRALMDYCIADAEEKGKSGICMLGASRQRNWLSSQAFAKNYGFRVVDSTEDGYELLALSFDGTVPKFTEKAKKQRIENQELTIYYSMQCPFVLQKVEEIRHYCEMNEVSVSMFQVTSLEQAKELPCVFNNYGAFYQGRFVTVNLLDVGSVQKILRK